jgi:hypothetical protein
MSEREISCQISKLGSASTTSTPPSGAKCCQLELTAFPRSASEIFQPDEWVRVATIRILVKSVDRRGRSSATLGDTVLISASRQPFLAAARVLISAGHEPDSWLEVWRPGATAFALRGRLGIAAALTVDESKTAFAKWKAFSSSAVHAGIAHFEPPATTLASAAFEPTQALPFSSTEELGSTPSGSTR